MSGPLFLVLLSLMSEGSGQIMAGAARVDCTLPVGAPLAGINHGARRAKGYPIPSPTRYTTWMTPSTGVLDPIYCRALTIRQLETNVSVSFVSIDAVGALGAIRRNAVRYAHGLGFTVPLDNVILSGSHTHSGPGAIASDFLWSIAPATDLEIPMLAEGLALNMAQALVQSQQNMRPALVDAGVFNLTGMTRNRRCHISPYVNCDTIDPNLAILRVDDASDGSLIAAIWNFAMHGTCLGSDNLQFSGDIMGRSSALMEKETGAVILFQNADAGDVDPDYSLVCSGDPDSWAGPPMFSSIVLNHTRSLKPAALVNLEIFSNRVNFGPVVLNATLARFDNCSSGGELDICTLCRVIDCHLNAGFQSGWIETEPLFTAVRLDVNGKKNVFVTVPGEALVELGWNIRNDTFALGYDQTFLTGYSNAHLGYFAPPDEYDVGGYESQMTFWGIQTSQMVRDAVFYVAAKLAPTDTQRTD